MRTRAEQPKATKRPASDKPAAFDGVRSEHGADVDSILRLQGSIGNRSVQCLLESDAPESKIDTSTACDTVRLGQAAPIKSPQVAVQAELAICSQGDAYEQEAVRVSEEVLRIPEARSSGDPPHDEGPHGSQPFSAGLAPSRLISRRIDSHGSGQSPSTSGVDDVLRSPGRALNPSTRAFMESRLGYDFGAVRVHTDPLAAASAHEMGARAYTVGNHIAFAADHYRLDGAKGTRLIAHELTHVVQQGSAQRLSRAAERGAPGITHRSPPKVARAPNVGSNQSVTSLDSYQAPGSKQIYRVGDTALTFLLMDIQKRGSQVVFMVFNFETGQALEKTLRDWSFYRGAAIIGGGNSAIKKLGQQLSPAQWRRLWPNPMPGLLRMFEAKQLNLSDDALLTGYHGMIRSEASSTLDRNEQAIDSILGAPDRKQRIQDYATGLREASLVRDALVHRRDELSRRLVAQHSFKFGPPLAGTGPNMGQRMRILGVKGQIEEALRFWLSAFPLLTRLRTQEIGAAPVEERLTTIKANIVSTRQKLDKGHLDPMSLDAVRAQLTGKLGPRASAVVAAEDKSRARWAIASAVATTVAMVAILFLPGGIFIDAAIGIAIAGHSIANAIEVGRRANTGLHVDDGLVSQSQAESAHFSAVLSTVFAVVGAAAAGFRILRVGHALHGLQKTMPKLSLMERGAVARTLADNPALLKAYGRIAPGDTMIGSRVAAAVRQTAGDPKSLKAALGDIASIAKIPRPTPQWVDHYKPLRNITDGSDIDQIAKLTKFSREEVKRAKQHLMFDEHILVDNASKLPFRGRFEPIASDAKIWEKAARGATLTTGEKKALGELIRHETVESAILGASRQSLEGMYLRGELRTALEAFLKTKGKSPSDIALLLEGTPKPITPYQYAHITAHYSGGPNPGSLLATQTPLP